MRTPSRTVALAARQIGRSRLFELAAKIDLGRKPGMDCGMVGPKTSMPQVWYPGLYIDTQTRPIDLPDKGRAIIDYVITRKTVSMVDGKQRHDAALDVHSIEAMPADGKKPKLPGSAKVLKIEGFGSLTPGMITFADTRPRDGEGQFAPETGAGPDPNAMAKAYGPAAIQQQASTSAGSGLVAGGSGGPSAAALLARKLRGKI